MDQMHDPRLTNPETSLDDEYTSSMWYHDMLVLITTVVFVVGAVFTVVDVKLVAKVGSAEMLLTAGAHHLVFSLNDLLPAKAG